MGMETMQMPEGEWKKQTADFHLDPSKLGNASAFEQVVRETAIEGAELSELEEAVENMETKLSKKPGDATTLEALAKVRSRIDQLIEKGQN